MKKEYISPELSEIQFDTEDVLSFSVINSDTEGETDFGLIPFPDNW